MSAAVLIVELAGPGVTVQDGGRPGWLDHGLSRGGAADPLALAEGAALLSQPEDLAAIELMAGPARFALPQGGRVALSGTPMRAMLTGASDAPPRALDWAASHVLAPGARLALAPLPGMAGFSYLHLGGGLDTPRILGARAAHLSAGIGRALAPGDALPLGRDPAPLRELALPETARSEGGEIRVLPSLHTGLFPPALLERFQTSVFHRDLHGNRMGMRLTGAGGFALEAGLTLVSELVQPGDIQITGDGTPFVLLAECQSMGGYPRIATVLPCDLPRVVQARPGAPLRFRLIEHDSALEALRAAAAHRAALPARARPRLRDPRSRGDLLSLNLIGGMISATDPEGNLP